MLKSWQVSVLCLLLTVICMIMILRLLLLLLLLLPSSTSTASLEDLGFSILCCVLSHQQVSAVWQVLQTHLDRHWALTI